MKKPAVKRVLRSLRTRDLDAEKEGFEPSKAVKPCLVSSEVLSASQSPLRSKFYPFLLIIEEAKRFELLMGRPMTVFKTVAFNRSATLPYLFSSKI